MLKRTITGTIYILVLLGFFILRTYFAEPLFFDLLVLFFSVVGTYEMCRALGDRIDVVQKCVIQIFSAGFIVAYCVSDAVYQRQGIAPNYSPNIAFVVFVAGMALLCSLLVFRHEKTSLSSTGYSMLAYVYPSVFLLVLAGLNHMPRYSAIGILLVFVLCPCADAFAYFAGRLLGKRFPWKMAPNVSPNKTVVGGIGGILGGAIGAVALFYAYHLIVNVWGVALGEGEMFRDPVNLILFVGIGVLTAAFAEAGDLVESAIKRRLDIKDMGNILPGHGGVLDRIDSALYACLIVCFVLVLRNMIAG